MNLWFLPNPVLYPWRPDDPDQLGGTEGALVRLAAELAARGHAVVVAYDGAPQQVDGVTYVERATTPAVPVDVLICWNHPEGAATVPALRRVLWTHQERAVAPYVFDHVVALSPYHQRILRAQSPAIAERVVVLPCGWDTEPLLPVDPEATRDAGLVLHAASPDRGLVHLLRLWPEVLAAHPTARLRVTQGWDLFDRLNGPAALKAEITERIAALPSVTMAHATRPELASLYETAGVWAYYCTGGEMFCQAAVAAQMRGAVPVVRPWGALHDTVWAGLTADDPASFRDALIRALDPATQEELRRTMAGMAPTWRTVAAAWEDLLAAPTPETVSRLASVPATPTALLPVPARAAPGTALALLQQWAGGLGGVPLWIDPALGIGSQPDAPQAWCLGWQLEDDARTPEALLRAHRVRPGAPVLAFVSIGAWRATDRVRVFDRRAIMEVFGTQRDLGMNATPLNHEGDAVCAVTFRYVPDAVGRRDVQRVRRTTAARETLSVCMIAPPVLPDGVLLRALRSVEPIADQVCIAVNGDEPASTMPGTSVADLLADWGRASGIPTVLVPDARSPRWCFDCLRIHAVGEMAPGHRVAGFETPRNQSLGAADGDWIAWLDCDEQLIEADRLTKYLRPNAYEGYGLPQDHYSSDPPAAFKRDTPIRLFRRTPRGTAGWFDYGDHAWPTYDPGLTARFAGIVHEHPGHAPLYTEGLGPVVILSDLWIAHTGYLTEPMRRGRFLRNWPLMVADRQKYPQRRLGQFLWLRDLSHHCRYLLEQSQGRPTAEVVSCAEEAVRLFETHFVHQVDPYIADAMAYVGVCYQILGRGLDAQVSVTLKRPEVTGDEAVAVQFGGRIGTTEQLLALVKAHLAGTERWDGAYV